MGFWDMLGSRIGALLLILTTLERVIPHHIWFSIERFFQKLLNSFNPYIEVTFDEFPPESYGHSKAYAAIQTYLGTKFSIRADRLKARISHESRSLALSMDDYVEITDVYNGVKISWMRTKSVPRSNVININGKEEEKRADVMSFRKKHRDVVMGSYLTHVLNEGKAIRKRSRRQRLYTNVSGDDWGNCDKMMWQCVGFEHPATFETLAMDPKKKKDIMDDLIEYTKGEEYYKSIGKPWKRGYLLYGPPGTGKSTMIAAMANFLHYDVYDLELTAVKDNTHLKKLMIEISKRAIVVIEDIDCSLHITGRRKANNTGEKDNIKNDDLKEAIIKKAKEEEEEEEGKTDDDSKSKVTLSGLLNFMDGLWSASGGERIFIFTTNHVEKIDDALVRRGRMDKHIEMSYCGFQAFKVLAKNYLKLESHDKFEKIRCLLSETDVSPADVAENLMPKSVEMSVEECLDNLIMALSKEDGEGKKLNEGVLEDEGNGENLRLSKVKRSLKSRIKGILLKNRWAFREKLC